MNERVKWVLVEKWKKWMLTTPENCTLGQKRKQSVTKVLQMNGNRKNVTKKEKKRFTSWNSWSRYLFRERKREEYSKKIKVVFIIWMN